MTQLKNEQLLRVILQRTAINGQQAHEKMLDIVHHQGNAQENQTRCRSTSRRGCYEADRQRQVLSTRGNWNLHVLLSVMQRAALFRSSLTTSLDGKLVLPSDPPIPPRHAQSRAIKAHVYTESCISTFTHALFTVAKRVKTTHMSISYIQIKEIIM